MLPLIKLKGHLHTADGKSASVVSVISIDQAYQKKEEFEAFCLKLNAEFDARNCHEVTIIETGYLKRHYLRLDPNFKSLEEADLAAVQLGKDWVEQQQSSIDQLKMPAKVLSWKGILEARVGKVDKPFSDYLAIVKNDYENDKCFHNHVERLSKKYAEKLAERYNPNNEKNLSEKCLTAARDYLLEESSIIFKLVHYGFTRQLYPGSGNAALRYIYKKYFGKTNPLPWIEYIIQYPNVEKKFILKDSNSPFFQAATNKNEQSSTIKKNIKLQLNQLREEERIEFIYELYDNCTKQLNYGI